MQPKAWNDPGPIPNGLTETDMALGNLWFDCMLGAKTPKQVIAGAGACHELLKAGWTVSDLENEITSENRRRTEPVWEFEKRMLERRKAQEASMIDHDWATFVAVFLTEWPKAGGNLADWREQPPFRDATLKHLIEAIRIVRANPEQAKHANKFSLLASALRELRRGQNRIVPKKTVPQNAAIVDDGRPDSECSAGMLTQRYGYIEAHKILDQRRRKDGT